jgi:tetratricopeptide (TPR) repeat protein
MKRRQSKRPGSKSVVADAHPAALLAILFLLTATAVVYWQVREHQFLNYDDNIYITENPHIQVGLNAEGIKWAFTSGYAANWHPLTWLSHMADVDLFGLNPAGHHLMNLAIHLASSLMLFLVMRTMTVNQWASWFIAAVFALHPLHVESVAWAAERKDVLSTLLWMAVLWSYVRYVKDRKRGWYMAMLAFYALGLMSKPMLVTLPFVLLLMDYWPLERTELVQPAKRKREHNARKTNAERDLWVSLVIEKLPLLAMAAASSIVTLLVQRGSGAVQSWVALSLTSRIANAVVSYCRYLIKTIWPFDLAVYYPHPGHWPPWSVAMSAVILIAISGIAARERRRKPYLAVGWLWYIVTLAPVIGIVQVGSQSMADRYMYLPLIGLTIMFACSAVELVESRPTIKNLIMSTGSVIPIALMVITWRQVSFWNNSATLFEHAINVTNNNWMAHNNLGVELLKRKRVDEALYHYSEAQRLNPNFAVAHFNMAAALAEKGQLDDAIPNYMKALRINPDYPEVHNNLGMALHLKGSLDEAVEQYREALRIKPEYLEAQNNLAGALLDQGKHDEAIAHYQELLRFNSSYPPAYAGMGLVLAGQGRFADAIAQYEQAIRINPDYAEAHNNMGIALTELGRLDEAITQYSEAVRSKPNYAEAHNNFAVALSRRGRLIEAIAHCREALRIKPDYPEARSNLEKALYAQRSGSPSATP